MNIYWALWILVGFGVPEGWALITHHPERTLSDTVWKWFDVVPGQTIWEWKAVHFALLMVVIWLGGHLVFRLWR